MMKKRKSGSGRKVSPPNSARLSAKSHERAVKDFDEAVENITKFADSGNFPQIYDPLKSCFEVLKPFHLTDLNQENDFENFVEEIKTRNVIKDDSDYDKEQQSTVHVPPLNLTSKHESDVFDSDFETQVSQIPQSSATTSPSKPTKRSKKKKKEITNDSSSSSDEEEKSARCFRSGGGDSKIYSRRDKSAKSGKSVKSSPRNRGDAPTPTLKSPKKKTSARKSVPKAISSSDESGERSQISIDEPLTDKQVSVELKLADERATRTVKMIEQVREAIASYQAKDTMTDEDNKELKRNQRKLSKNLNQLERITARVKHLVGFADKSFQQKWEEMEGDKVFEDLQAGGDTVGNDELPCTTSDEPKEINTEISTVSLLKEEDTMENQESSRDVTNEKSEDEAEKEEDEIQDDKFEVELLKERPESPRSKLRSDLDKLAEEIKMDMTDSEMDSIDTREELEDTKSESKIHESDVQTDSEMLVVKQPNLDESLPKVVLFGSDSPMQKIVSETKFQPAPSVPPLDGMSVLQPPSIPSVDSEKSVPEVMLSLTGRLSESYSMQEKLAAENADLEGLRYQLQEELLTKENAVEHLQRKVANLQAEMRLIVRENAQLNDKLGQGSNQPFEEKIKIMPGTGGDDVDHKLKEYKQTTHVLETQLAVLENDVKKIQEELSYVQRDRQELENHRKMMKINIGLNVQRRGMGTHGGLISPLPPRDSNTDLQLKELREQYDRLQQDYKNKMLEVASLRAGNEKLMEITDKAREERDFCETQCRSLEKRLKELESEKSKMLGSKEQLFEQEQHMSVIKLRYREAQDEIDELRNTVDDQATQLEDYRNKYLQAQQQVEEQIRQIDHMEMENQRSREEVNAEIQRIKQQFQDKLAELTPLPDILKDTQMKLQEAQQLRLIAERNLEDCQREMQEIKDRSHTLVRRIESERSNAQLGLDERSQLMAKLESWEKKCNELRDENAKMKTSVARLEEAALQNDKRLDEKLHEVAQLSSQLETLREEAARQVARTKDRTETIKRSLQNQIADLERQLAQARATARTAQKDKDEIRQRMQSQINSLNDNFEQAQLRIKSLQSHVNFLKNSYSGIFSPEASSMSLVDTSPSNYVLDTPLPCNPCDCTY